MPGAGVGRAAQSAPPAPASDSGVGGCVCGEWKLGVVLELVILGGEMIGG